MDPATGPVVGVMLSWWDEVWAEPPRHDNGTTPNGVVIPIATANGTRYAATALQREVDDVASTPEGGRNHRLNVAAFNLGTLIAAGHLESRAVEDALLAAARSAGLGEAESIATITSGLRGGAQHPRVVPEPTPSYDVAAATVLEEDAESIEDLFPILDWHELWASDDEEEWIIEPILPARRGVALYSAPKVGKSLLMLEIAAGLARGTETLGITPSRPWRVLYVDFENDPRGDIRTRLQSMEISPGELDNLCYLSFPTLAKLDTAMGGMQLVAVAQHYRCEVVIIDTVSRAVGGEENSNDTWLSFYRNTGLALKTLGIAYIRLDHTGKDHGKGMRGGSAKYGDVDAVWKLEATSDATFTLECTDHRMPIPEPLLALSRQDYPLCHKVVGTHWNDALDSQAIQVDQALTDLGIAPSTSVRDCGRALRENGRRVTQAVLVRAVKTRKLRLDITTEGGR